MNKPWLEHYDTEVPATIQYPRMPLYCLLDDSAARFADEPCTCFFGKVQTYAQVRALSDRLAAGLRQLGLQPGDRVALLLPNSPQFVLAYYGALKAGAVVVALNPLTSDRELVYQLCDSGSATVITIPLFLPKIAALRDKTALKRVIYSPLADFMPAPLSWVQGFRERRQIQALNGAGRPEDLNLKELLRAAPGPDFHPAEVDPDDMAVLLYSGGTTGVAKGIMLSHVALVANAYQIAAWGHLGEHERLLAVLPLFHGYGMSVNLNATLRAGGATILVPRFNARDVAQTIARERPTFFAGVPTMFVALSNLPDIARYDFSSLHGIFVGAAPLTRAIKENFESKTGGRMIEGYGLTEAVTAIMANPYHGQHKVGSIGLPFSDVEAKIVGLEDGRELPPCERGEIVLRSPTLMLGYYHNPDETAATVANGWLHTGDIGYRDEDSYFYITDRKKDIIKVGGFIVFPREIDEVIYGYPKVSEGIAVGLPDAYKGERIRAYIVLKPGETATAEELLAYFRQNLTPYKVPSEVEFRAELPKNMIGKVLRRALREEALLTARG